MDSSIRQQLNSRLRKDPIKYTVPKSLPVLFFGDIFKATVATVGLNPSDQEYLDPQGIELDGISRRFHTLTSLKAESRSALTDAHCEIAIETMRQYFLPNRPIYRWFRSLNRLTKAMGYNYSKGEVVHIDLSQEATNPTWSKLRKIDHNEFQQLRARGLPFLKWQIEIFPLRVLVCDGKTAFSEVADLIGARIIKIEPIARIEWFIAETTLLGRRVCVTGWNIPLARPTGLGIEGEQNLGNRIRKACEKTHEVNCQ